MAVLAMRAVDATGGDPSQSQEISRNFDTMSIAEVGKGPALRGAPEAAQLVPQQLGSADSQFPAKIGGRCAEGRRDPPG